MKVTAIIRRWGEGDDPYSHRGHSASDVFEVRHDPIEPCCEEMEDAMDEGFVGFGDKDTCCNEDRRVNIYNCSPYPDGASWDSMPIERCPWCGEAITVDEREGETVAEQARKRLPKEIAQLEQQAARLRERLAES